MAAMIKRVGALFVMIAMFFALSGVAYADNINDSGSAKSDDPGWTVSDVMMDEPAQGTVEKTDQKAEPSWNAIIASGISTISLLAFMVAVIATAVKLKLENTRKRHAQIEKILSTHTEDRSLPAKIMPSIKSTAHIVIKACIYGVVALFLGFCTVFCLVLLAGRAQLDFAKFLVFNCPLFSFWMSNLIMPVVTFGIVAAIVAYLEKLENVWINSALHHFSPESFLSQEFTPVEEIDARFDSLAEASLITATAGVGVFAALFIASFIIVVQVGSPLI